MILMMIVKKRIANYIFLYNLACLCESIIMYVFVFSFYDTWSKFFMFVT